jgi:hypothetical protein
MQEAHLSVQKFPAGDEMAEGQAVDVQEFGYDRLRDPLSEVLPDPSSRWIGRCRLIGGKQMIDLT